MVEVFILFLFMYKWFLVFVGYVVSFILNVNVI